MRQVSFLETGRARPRRETLDKLAGALQLPAHETSLLLRAFGFASFQGRHQAATPPAAEHLEVLRRLIAHLDPYPAVIVNGRWDLLQANRGFCWLFDSVCALRLFPHGAFAPSGPPRPNFARLLSPSGSLRKVLVNGDQVAAVVQRQLMDEAEWVGDPELGRLAKESLGAPISECGMSFPLRIELRVDSGTARFFASVLTLGVPREMRVRGLRLEYFWPADRESRRWFKRRLPESSMRSHSTRAEGSR